MRRVLFIPQRVAIALLRGYQLTLGRMLGGRCRFHPSCSEYAIEAIQLNGLVAGGVQAAWRLVRCAPWSAGGVEHPRPLRLRIRRPAHG